jgi:arylsulfatase A-like enzyme
VMLVDVAPTLLEAVQARIPPSFLGRSLGPALAGGTLPARSVYAELLPAPGWDFAATALLDADGKSKIIYQQSRAFFELYDLAVDPAESNNLIEQRPDLAARMKHELATWMDGID